MGTHESKDTKAILIVDYVMELYEQFHSLKQGMLVAE